MSTSSTNKLLEWLDADDPAARAMVLELHTAVGLRENRVVLTESRVQAGLKTASALPDDDRAAGHDVAVVRLHAQPLRVRVADVAGAAVSLFVSHKNLEKDVLDPYLRKERAVPLGPAHALPALFLEHPDFRAARLTVHDGDDPGVGDKRRTGEDFTAVAFDDQHLVQREFRARFARGAIQRRDAARRHLDLMAARLNDCVHNRHLCKGDSLLSKSLRCKE